MTKNDLSSIITNTIGFSKKESQNIVDQIFEIMKSTLESGEQVKISGLGTWTVNDKKSRKGRNPATGEDLMLEGRKVLKFIMSNRLKGKMNSE
jgi:integration host factor subunit alpha